MNATARRLAAVAVLLTGSLTSCGRSTSETSPTRAAQESPCPAPALVPTYLPDGVHPTKRAPLFGAPDRTRTWEGDGALVQLLEGFSGDHGEEPRLKTVTVRGDDYARLLPGKDETDVTTVDWRERTRCGFKQYLVVTKDLSETETLKIARAMEGSTR